MRAIAIPLAVLLLGAAATSAAAATCTDGQELLTQRLPTHVHAGEELALEIESAAVSDGEVSAVSVAVDGVATSVTPAPGDVTTVRLRAPDRLGRFRVSVRWQQAALADGSSPACAGADDLTVTAVRPGLRIGDTEAPRIAGRWRMTFTPMSYDAPAENAIWTVTPSCDLGACAFRVRSSGDARYRFAADERRTYRFSSRVTAGPAADCTITTRYANGSTRVRRVHGAYFAQRDASLRVTGSAAGSDGIRRATRIEGLLRDHFLPTGTGRAHGCKAITRTVRLVGVQRAR